MWLCGVSFSFVWKEAECLAQLLVLMIFLPLAVPQCSMRLQVRTTSLQQRSEDRMPGIWLLCVYFWRRCFLLNHPQQVDKSSRQEHRRKYTLGITGRVAEPGVIHRGNFAVAYFRFQHLLRGELNAACTGLRIFPQMRPNGSRDQNWPNLDVQWKYCQVSKNEKGECRLDYKPRERQTGITVSCTLTSRVFVEIHTAVFTFEGC